MNGAGTFRILSRLWFVVIGVVVIAILYLAKILFLPLAFAILFAFLLAPLVSRLERLHLPRALSAFLVIMAFAALLGTAAWILFSQLVLIANDLPTYRENIQHKIRAIHSPSNSPFGRAESEVQRLSDELSLATSSLVIHPSGAKAGSGSLQPVPVREVPQPSGRLVQLGGIAGALTTALLCVVFTFFILLQREDLRNRVIRLSGQRNLTMMTQAMNDAGGRISRYFSLQLLVNLVYGTLIFITLHFIGLPHALLFGSLAGLLRFVPYVGAPIAALLPTLLSLAVFHGWMRSLLILGTFVLLELFTANYAEPHIYGRHTGLSSLAILLAAAFWTMLWGPVGLVLSVPLTVCLVVMGSHIPTLEFLTVMLGDRPVVPPSICYYQRLLAHDQHEAGEILESCLKDNSLETTYDSVLVPALTLAQQERFQGELDDSTLEFVRRTSRDIIDELGLRETTEPPNEPPPSPGLQSVKVLCVPVRDETDELGATMLAQLLDAEGISSTSIPIRHVDEILATVAAENPTIVFLCGLPPFAMARAHRLYHALRARHPHLRLMIGIWGYADDLERASERITRGASVRIATTLAEAVSQVRSFAAPGEPALSSQSGESAA
jgi:predicted PurR-regulated permease PerM